MAIPRSATILHHLRQTVLHRGGTELSDGQLLRSFLYRGDETAFEALVRRHGPMVRGVCRRILRNDHDADDAFQAAFLVLVRKASILEAREVIGDWLHGVAYRTALKARAAAARRCWKEQQALRREAIEDKPDHSEWLPLLDQEISLLPAKYRQPIVLCDLEGRTRKDAAERLGWPEGTLSGRLSRARAMLARRLIRRGVTLSAATLMTGMAGEASTRLPFSLVGTTCKAAMGSVPAQVAALTEGVVKAMFVAKMKTIAAAMTIVLVLAAGVGVWRYAAVAGQTNEPGEVKSLPPKTALPKEKGPIKEEEEKIGPIPPAPRSFRFDLSITREEDGKRKRLAAPQLIAPEGQDAYCGLGPGFVYSVGRKHFFRFNEGPSVQVKVCSDEKDGLCLDMRVNEMATAKSEGSRKVDVTAEGRSLRVLRWFKLGQPITVKLRTGDKNQDVLEVTAAIHEIDRGSVKVMETRLFPAEDPSQSFPLGYAYSVMPAPGSVEWKEQKKKRTAMMIAAAEKDLKIAEFYRKAGHPDSAHFYYELIRERYPNTECAKRAAQRLAEEKPPARVGQIHLRGNKKTSDEIILEQVNLYPGQVLTLPDLDIAERKVSKLKGLKSAKVTVIDREGDGTYKDIEIQVEEK